MEKIISRCGLICSNCEAYIATQANDPAALERVAKHWTEEFHSPFTVADVVCDGCLTTSGRLCSYAPKCEIRACAIQHNVLNCAYCDEYGCARITGFLAQVPEAKKTLEEIRASRSSA